jgi:hypothetical protein
MLCYTKNKGGSKKMDEELISKKEILEQTGISYGQLYRWKRKNLIPEDWFIKKSSFTGQETFFPKSKILDRIDKIKDMKDDLSLDDIADVFSPQLTEIFLSKEDLVKRNIVTQMCLNIYEASYKDTLVFEFEKILFIYILEKFLQSGETGVEEGKIILNTLEDNYKNFQGAACDIILIRKLGIGVCLLVNSDEQIFLDKGSKLVLRVNSTNCIENLKTAISNNLN